MRMQWWQLPRQPLWDKEGNVVPDRNIVAVWVRAVKGDLAKQYALYDNGQVMARTVQRHGPHRWEGDWRKVRKAKYRFRPELIDNMTRSLKTRGYKVAYRTKAML